MSTSGTIAGLDPSTTYECTIHAVTILDGPASDPITVTTDPGMYTCSYIVTNTVRAHIWYVYGINT